MKRVLSTVLVFVLTLSFSGCGSNESKLAQNDEKGTRSNPYQVGETVQIEDFKSYYNGYKYADVLFDLELTVNQSYSVAEGIAIRESRYDSYTAIPTASITFTLTGNYDNEMTYGDIFRVGVVDEKMQTEVFSVIEDENQKDQSIIYTGVEYTVNILNAFDQETKTAEEAKYYVIYFRDADETEKYIYIAAEPHESSAVQPENPKHTEEPKIISNEEEKYGRALLAEEKGYYTIARNIFSEILDYGDSQEHFDNVNNILQEYNGTYYGESTQYQNVNVYLYIEDGCVTAQFEGQEKSLSEYELYLYGEKEDGTPILAFANELTSLFQSDPDTSYDDCVEGFAIQKLEDGEYLVAATTYSTGCAWNGFYKKIY